MTDEPIWIGRTEMLELLNDGEAIIAGDQYQLTEAAKGARNRWKDGDDL